MFHGETCDNSAQSFSWQLSLSSDHQSHQRPVLRKNSFNSKEKNHETVAGGEFTMRTCLQNKSVQTQRFFYAALRKAVSSWQKYAYSRFSALLSFRAWLTLRKVRFSLFHRKYIFDIISMKKKTENPLFWSEMEPTDFCASHLLTCFVFLTTRQPPAQ